MSEAASIGNQKVRAVSLPSHVAAIISKCSRLLGMLSVFAMLAAICIEVFSRGALGSATIWVTEVTTYLVVITTFVGAAFVESRSANVRIELVVDSLRPSRRQYVMEALRWIAVVAILVALWRSAGLLMQNYITGSRSWSLLNTPLWMPQTSVVFGLTGLVFVLAFGAKPHGGLSGYLLFPFLVAAVLFDALQWFSLGVPPVQGVALIAAATLLIAILCSGVTVAAIAVAITAPLLGVFILAGSAALAVKSALLIAALFLLLLTGLPVAFSLLTTGIISMVTWFPPTSLNYIGERAWEAVNIFELAAIPMFVLMGSVLVRSNASTEMFMATKIGLGRLRGGLAHASVLASGIFAAVSGSSIATAATMGRVAAPEMLNEGYKPELTFGVLAAGGTLGILIPPSIAMIIYGPLAGVPVTKLFMAGILPGLLMMAVFSMVVVLWLAIDRNAAPAGTSYSLAQKLSALKGVLPFLLLMTIVLGSLYAGIATPTEAGAVGVLGAVLISVLRGTFSLNEMLASLEEAALATSFLLLIAVGAAVFSFAVDFLAMPQALIAFMKALDLSSFGLFLSIVAVYLVLGMFVEPISMVLITLPVVLPVILAAGWDPLWFGIILVMLVEIGMITPPVGMILYVLSGVSNGRATLGQIAAGAMPFVVAFLAMIFVFYAQPVIITFLPELIK